MRLRLKPLSQQIALITDIGLATARDATQG